MIERLEKRLAATVPGFAVLFALIYFAGTLAADIRRPLWYDEIFARYVSRLDSPSAIWQALRNSVDNQPFPFYVLTHYSQKLFGDNSFALRIPETLGFAILCVSIYIFTRVRTNRLYALGAALFPFASGVIYYATEGRPYGLELGFCGLMLISWQAATGGRYRTAGIAGLALSAAGAVSSHYLAVLLFIPIGIGELTRTVMRRRWDPAIWAALITGLAPLIAWLPAIRATHIYAAHFWAAPSFTAFLDCYQWLNTPAIVPAALAAFFLITAKSKPGIDADAAPVPLYEGVAAAAFLLLPLFELALSPMTGVLHARYVTGIIAGTAILFGLGFQRAGRGTAGVALAFATLMAAQFTFSQATNLRSFPPLREGAVRALLEKTKASGLPIVVTESQDYLEAFDGLEPDDDSAKSRLWYVVNDVRTGNGPDTDDLALERLAQITPLHVLGTNEFLPLHPTFLVAQARPTWLIPWLVAQGATVKYTKGEYPLLHVEAAFK